MAKIAVVLDSVLGNDANSGLMTGTIGVDATAVNAVKTMDRASAILSGHYDGSILYVMSNSVFKETNTSKGLDLTWGGTDMAAGKAEVAPCYESGGILYRGVAGNPGKAVGDYMGSWTPNRVVAKDDYCVAQKGSEKSILAAFRAISVTAAALTGLAAPAWPSSDGLTVQDNNVLWQRVSLSSIQAFNGGIDSSGAANLATGKGQYIEISDFDVSGWRGRGINFEYGSGSATFDRVIRLNRVRVDTVQQSGYYGRNVIDMIATECQWDNCGRIEMEASASLSRPSCINLGPAPTETAKVSVQQKLIDCTLQRSWKEGIGAYCNNLLIEGMIFYGVNGCSIYLLGTQDFEIRYCMGIGTSDPYYQRYAGGWVGAFLFTSTEGVPKPAIKNGKIHDNLTGGLRYFLRMFNPASNSPVENLLIYNNTGVDNWQEFAIDGDGATNWTGTNRISNHLCVRRTSGLGALATVPAAHTGFTMGRNCWPSAPGGGANGTGDVIDAAPLVDTTTNFLAIPSVAAISADAFRIKPTSGAYQAGEVRPGRTVDIFGAAVGANPSIGADQGAGAQPPNQTGDLSVKNTRIAKAVTAVAQTFAHGFMVNSVSDTPKLSLKRLTQGLSDGVYDNLSMVHIGIVDHVHGTQYALCNRLSIGGANTSTGQIGRQDSSVLFMSSGSNTIAVRGVTTAIDATNETINWVTNTANANLLHNTYIGGAAVKEIKCGVAALGNVNVDTVINGMTNAPNVMLLFHLNRAIDGTASAGAYLTEGRMVKTAGGTTKQGCRRFYQPDGVSANSNSVVSQLSATYIGGVNTTAPGVLFDIQGALTSVGATLTPKNGNANIDVLYVLLSLSVDVDLEFIDLPHSGAGGIAVPANYENNTGELPKWILRTGTNLTTNNATAGAESSGWSASSITENDSITAGFRVQQNSATVINKVVSDDVSINQPPHNSSTPIYVGTLVTMDSDGFTENFTAVPATSTKSMDLVITNNVSSGPDVEAPVISVHGVMTPTGTNSFDLVGEQITDVQTTANYGRYITYRVDTPIPTPADILNGVDGAGNAATAIVTKNGTIAINTALNYSFTDLPYPKGRFIGVYRDSLGNLQTVGSGGYYITQPAAGFQRLETTVDTDTFTPGKDNLLYNKVSDAGDLLDWKSFTLENGRAVHIATDGTVTIDRPDGDTSVQTFPYFHFSMSTGVTTEYLYQDPPFSIQIDRVLNNLNAPVISTAVTWLFIPDLSLQEILQKLAAGLAIPGVLSGSSSTTSTGGLTVYLPSPMQGELLLFKAGSTRPEDMLQSLTVTSS